jgi:serine/threonine protein kinase/tetratricopeptide (TPR) repeat protein
MAVHAMPVAAGQRLGRYRLERRVGSGGMAEVWEALDESLHRPVAVKVILDTVSREPTFTERFVREARTIAGLEHPNILPIYDFGQEGEAVYLVMPLVPGGSLKDRLRSRVPAAAAIEWISGIASALDYGHTRGILHRDVKPANVLMDKNNRPLLADFGLAKSVGDTTAGLTATGAVIGTPTYMSPEQALAAPLDGRSDQYSLGVIAFQLIAGVVPFAADSPLIVLRKHLQEPPPPPSHLDPTLSPAVDRAIERALRKDPAERYASCGDLAKALALAFASTGAGAGAAGQATTGWSSSIGTGPPEQQTTKWSTAEGSREAEQPTTKWSTSAGSGADEHATTMWSTPAASRDAEQATTKWNTSGTPSAQTLGPPVEDGTTTRVAAKKQPRRGQMGFAAAAAAIVVLGAVLFLWRRTETKNPTSRASNLPPPSTVAAKLPVDTPRPFPSAAPAIVPAAPTAAPAPQQARTAITPPLAPTRPVAIAGIGTRTSPARPAAATPQPSLVPSPSASTGVSDAAWAEVFDAGQQAFRNGDYRGAQKLFREAVREAEKLDPKDLRLARSLQRLGMVLANLGHLPQAEAHLRRSLSMREEQPKSLSVDIADNQAWLGFTLARQRKPGGEAEALILQALATKEKALGPNDPAVAFVLQQLGYCYEMQGRHADAEPRLRRALSILQTSPGNNDGMRAAVLNDLGLMYEHKGEPAQAEPILREALAVRQRVLAPNHPLLAQTDINLADAEIDLKKYSEAEPLLRQALAIREKALGPDHPLIPPTLKDLARLLRLENREAEANQLLARARAIRTQKEERE